MNEASAAQNTAPCPYLSIVIPVYNESNRISVSLRKFDSWVTAQSFEVEVLVVDDGSTDNTRSQARDFATTHPWLTVIEEDHRGKANAVLAGLGKTRGTFAGFCDVDLATPLDTWQLCEEAFAEGASVAIASREGTGSYRVGEPWYRHAMGRAFNGLVRLLLLPGIHDTQCGYKFFSRAALDDILPRTRLYRDANRVSRPRVTAFDVELLHIARRHGFRIAVIPITWTYGEHTKVNAVTDTLQNLRDVLAVRWYATAGEYDRD